MATLLEDTKLAESVFETLDFPIIVVTEEGTIVTASPGAESLVPGLMTCEAGANLRELLKEPPVDFPAWLNSARENSTVRLGGAGEESSLTVMVKAAPWEGPGLSGKLWVLSLHRQESFSRRKYEREILLRISSVPIPEMSAEGIPLSAQFPERSPITRELLTMIVNYLGGRSGLLMRMEEGHRLSIIGYCGIPHDELLSLLGSTDGQNMMPLPEDGLLCRAACEGYTYSLSGQDQPEPPLQNISDHLAFQHRGVWIDGISGFGVAITYFSESPDREARQFATDAYVRLGRHLETCTYNNRLYEAYLELQNKQEQIIQSSKMAAIGEMATGMAHELRQPVTAINNFFTSIFDHLENERYDKIRKHLGDYRERLFRNIERLSRIIDHLRLFGRQEPVNFQKTDMNFLVDEIFNTFINTRLERNNIRILRQISPDLPRLEVDASRIEQVILNLVSNACDALEGVPDPAITIGLNCDGRTMKIAVSDNGPGISVDIMSKLFDPFFTTKAAGKGTGLGLSVSHGIVKGHNGELHADNRPEGGACFTIVLPLRQS